MTDSTAADYLDGSIKYHPDWPTVLMIAQRHPYDDNAFGGVSSWLGIAPGMGTTWFRHEQVKDWPDAEGLTRLKADEPAPPTPQTPPQTPDPVPPAE